MLKEDMVATQDAGPGLRGTEPNLPLLSAVVL